MANVSRSDKRAQFLIDAGWGDAVVEALPGDASFRHYFRLRKGKQHALLMDAPPETEDTHAYVSIARHLSGMGLSAPIIYAVEMDMGFAVIEDFGDQTYTTLLNQEVDSAQLYALAVDALIELHGNKSATAIDIPDFDTNKLVEETTLLVDWYLPAVTGYSTPQDVRNSYIHAWTSVFERLPSYEPTLVLCDYHVDNLMLLDGKKGITRCGLLDFQDALIGHPAYDLVSLLEDARRDVSDELVCAMRERYSSGIINPFTNDFDAWYTVMGAQRHARVAGIFVRLSVRDGKDHYLPHIPRVMRLLTRALCEPVLSPVKHWFDEHLPAPVAPMSIFNPAHINSFNAY